MKWFYVLHDSRPSRGKRHVTLVGKQGSERVWHAQSYRGLVRVRRERVLVDVGPDHYARFEAMEMSIRLMHHASADRRKVTRAARRRVALAGEQGVNAAGGAQAPRRSS